ncbi:MAG: transposase [Ktedonobacterales bacterium]|nr:transposase [Ktedonobacterales bacterium]
MGTVRRRHSSEFKAKLALEALKGQKTLNELASEYAVHPVQIAQWKRQAQAGLIGVFEHPSSRQDRLQEALVEQLYQEIGQLARRAHPKYPLPSVMSPICDVWHSPPSLGSLGAGGTIRMESLLHV